MPPTTRKVTAPNPYAPTQWGGEVYHDVETPSGQLCQCKKPGVRALIAAGLIEDLDLLTATVESEHIQRVKGKPPTNVNKILQDPKQLDRVFDIADRITAHVVVQPQVELPPTNVADRKPNVIYTDMIDDADKMYIMQWAMGGQQDLAKFREELRGNAGTLGAGADVQAKPVRAASSRRTRR